jgi:uncharacterized protein (TIGR02246 family)
MEDPSAAEEAAESVDATVLTLMHAWNHHDMRAWAACFTDDADYVDVSGTHWRGRSEIEARQMELHANAHRNSTMRISEWSIRFLNPETCLVDMRWDMKGGSIRKRKGMLTMVLVPDGTGWRASVAQNSDSLRSSF